MAVEQIRQGARGRMMALQAGRYTTVDLEAVSGGAKRVDVAALYDTEAYRPHIRQVGGKPMFLY